MGAVEEAGWREAVLADVGQRRFWYDNTWNKTKKNKGFHTKALPQGCLSERSPWWWSRALGSPGGLYSGKVQVSWRKLERFFILLQETSCLNFTVFRTFPRSILILLNWQILTKNISFAYFSSNHGSQLCTDIQLERGWRETARWMQTSWEMRLQQFLWSDQEALAGKGENWNYVEL